MRAIKVAQKEQEVRHKEYLNALTQEKNKEQTKLKHEFERISNEINTKYIHKMELMRKEMDTIRKSEIKRIQEIKDAAIADLISKHQKKYQDIKAYYQEITNTNLDIIK